MPSNDVRRKKWSDAHNGENVLNPGGEVSDGGLFSARIGADDYTAPSSVGSDGARSVSTISGTCETFGVLRHRRRVEPSAAPIASAPSAERPPHPSCCQSGAELNNSGDAVCGGEASSSGYGVGGVDASPETSLMGPDVLGEGGVEQAEYNDVGAADWLDATHALLDAVDGSG